MHHVTEYPVLCLLLHQKLLHDQSPGVQRDDNICWKECSSIFGQTRDSGKIEAICQGKEEIKGVRQVWSGFSASFSHDFHPAHFAPQPCQHIRHQVFACPRPSHIELYCHENLVLLFEVIKRIDGATERTSLQI
jgi:hypothetical protein